MPPLGPLLRFLAILGATLFWFGVWGLGALASVGRPAARRRARAFAFSRWGRGLLRRARVELRVVGAPPSAPFLLVANHSSYLDVPVLAALANGCFVAKAEIARWPLLGWLARGMGTVFVGRGAARALVEATGAIEHRLRRGYGVFLFPEGGIPPTPELGEFRGSLLEPALRANLPVHCAAIRHGCEAGVERVTWRRGEPLLAHFLALLAAPGATTTVVFGESALEGTDRKETARALRERVGELLSRARPLG